MVDSVIGRRIDMLSSFGDSGAGVGGIWNLEFLPVQSFEIEVDLQMLSLLQTLVPEVSQKMIGFMSSLLPAREMRASWNTTPKI